MARLIRIGVLPLLIGLIARAVFAIFNVNDITIGRIEFVLNSIITFASALSGFILSSLSILIGLSNSPVMVYIRKKGAMPELRCRYTSALLYCLFLIIYCVLAGMIIGSGTIIDGWCFTASIILVTAFLVSVVVTGKYLLSLIAIVPVEDPTTAPVYAPTDGFNFTAKPVTKEDAGTTQHL